MATRSDNIRIGLDARTMFAAQPRGAGRNLWDLFRVLPAIRPTWRFVLYHQREARGGIDFGQTDPLDFPNVIARRIDMPGDRLNLWLHVRLPVACWGDRIDLLHTPFNDAPRRCPTRLVSTVHDLAPLEDATLPTEHDRFRAGVRRAVQNSQIVITPSAATQTALAQHFQLAPERSVVAPWAPDWRLLERLATPTLQSDTATVRRRYGLERPYLLNFSGSAPRKNAAGLLHAFTMLPKTVRNTFDLVLTGCEPASFRDHLTAQTRRLQISQHVHLLPFVDHQDLAGLLAGANLMVMPSLCEGFGLPVLDAFAARVPVVTSNRGSLYEIASTAAVLCDPTQCAAIAAAIVEALDPARAAALRLAGQARVASYTWHRTAERVAHAYERALGLIPTRSAVGQGDEALRLADMPTALVLAMSGGSA